MRLHSESSPMAKEHPTILVAIGMIPKLYGLYFACLPWSQLSALLNFVDSFDSGDSRGNYTFADLPHCVAAQRDHGRTLCCFAARALEVYFFRIFIASACGLQMRIELSTCVNVVQRKGTPTAGYSQ